MLDLIIGGLASGKSSYGEELASAYYRQLNELQLNNKAESVSMYYVATMMAYDEESRKRIKKHQDMRKDKNFKTIECFYHMDELLEKGNDMTGENLPAIYLIECMSNLLANEIYAEHGSLKGKTLEEQKTKAYENIVLPIVELSKNDNRVIVITNEIFSDGGTYEKETRDYIALLGYINECLQSKAEHVTEVVCSIPVPMKGTLSC